MNPQLLAAIQQLVAASAMMSSQTASLAQAAQNLANAQGQRTGKSTGAVADPVQTFADYVRQTQSLMGAVQSLVQALQQRNDKAGIKTSTGESLLSGAAGNGWFANLSRLVSQKGKWKATGAERAKKIRAAGARKQRSIMKRAVQAHQQGNHRLANKLQNKSVHVGAKAGTAAKAAEAEVAGSAAMRFAGPVGIAGAAVFEFGKAVISATDAAVQSNRKYAEMSASMALVFAQRDIQEMFRDRDKGQALAGSASKLVKEEQERKDVMKPIEILLENIQNNALADLNKAISFVLGPLSRAVEKWLKDKGITSSELEDNVSAGGEGMQAMHWRLDQMKKGKMFRWR